MATVLTAASEMITKLQSLSGTEANWTASTWSTYGDWAAKIAPEISYNSIIEKKNITSDTDKISCFVGFNFREVGPQNDRCDGDYIYPLGVGIYQRFRPTGAATPGGLITKVDPTVVSSFMQLCEDLEGLLYFSKLTSFGYVNHESFFDHETLDDQYLKQVFVFRYRES